MKNKKILVVGGSGYIGGAVTDLLTKEGVDFTVYDNLLYEYQYMKPANFIFGDVRDYEKLGKILPEYSHVIWLAAIVGDPACQVKPDLTRSVNQDSVEWLSKNYDGRIVFLSTCSVYGKNENEVSEDSKLNPLSLYAETKMRAEEFLKEKDSVMFRLGTVYGVSDTYSRIRMDLAVNYMTANAVTKGHLSIFGGSQWRPLIHVKNVADAIVFALDAPVKGVYNISTSNYRISDLGAEIAEITGCGIEYVQESFEDQRNYHASVDKAGEVGFLDFENIWTVKDGATQIKNLVESKRIKYTENDIYFNIRHITNLNSSGELE